jgi:signal peptidase I
MNIPFFRKKPSGVMPEASPAPEKKMAFLAELVQVLLISLAIVLPVRYFLVQPFSVKGASMEPNFYDNEYLIIDALTYRLREPVRGEIVVFRPPNDRHDYYIKRVIGLPGETVEIMNGKVKVYNDEHPNGFSLDESIYLETEYTPATQTTTLKPEQYFLMGDNRPASLDSRAFGPVSREAIVGRVWLRGYPLDRWKHFEAPAYQE